MADNIFYPTRPTVEKNLNQLYLYYDDDDNNDECSLYIKHILVRSFFAAHLAPSPILPLYELSHAEKTLMHICISLQQES